MKNEKTKNINIELDEKTAQGQYSNLVVVNHSPTEFVLDFVNIMQQMKEVDCIEFDLGDIVRSGMLKSYLIEKIKMGLHYEQ